MTSILSGLHTTTLGHSSQPASQYIKLLTFGNERESANFSIVLIRGVKIHKILDSSTKDDLKILLQFDYTFLSSHRSERKEYAEQYERRKNVYSFVLAIN